MTWAPRIIKVRIIEVRVSEVLLYVQKRPLGYPSTVRRGMQVQFRNTSPSRVQAPNRNLLGCKVLGGHSSLGVILQPVVYGIYHPVRVRFSTWHVLLSCTWYCTYAIGGMLLRRRYKRSPSPKPDHSPLRYYSVWPSAFPEPIVPLGSAGERPLRNPRRDFHQHPRVCSTVSLCTTGDCLVQRSSSSLAHQLVLTALQWLQYVPRTIRWPIFIGVREKRFFLYPGTIFLVLLFF